MTGANGERGTGEGVHETPYGLADHNDFAILDGRPAWCCEHGIRADDACFQCARCRYPGCMEVSTSDGYCDGDNHPTETIDVLLSQQIGVKSWPEGWGIFVIIDGDRFDGPLRWATRPEAVSAARVVQEGMYVAHQRAGLVLAEGTYEWDKPPAPFSHRAPDLTPEQRAVIDATPLGEPSWEAASSGRQT